MYSVLAYYELVYVYIMIRCGYVDHHSTGKSLLYTGMRSNKQSQNTDDRRHERTKIDRSKKFKLIVTSCHKDILSLIVGI